MGFMTTENVCIFCCISKQPLRNRRVLSSYNTENVPVIITADVRPEDRTAGCFL